ncbi:hypothetical protein Q8A73_019451 [Channa argus]|nr:hypothetical protein Q8A73_019451 [Channa argus]
MSSIKVFPGLKLRVYFEGHKPETLSCPRALFDSKIHPSQFVHYLLGPASTDRENVDEVSVHLDTLDRGDIVHRTDSFLGRIMKGLVNRERRRLPVPATY